LGVNNAPLPLFPPKAPIFDPEVLKTHAKMKNAIFALNVHESPVGILWMEVDLTTSSEAKQLNMFLRQYSLFPLINRTHFLVDRHTIQS